MTVHNPPTDYNRFPIKTVVIHHSRGTVRVPLHSSMTEDEKDRYFELLTSAGWALVRYSGLEAHWAKAPPLGAIR